MPPRTSAPNTTTTTAWTGKFAPKGSLDQHRPKREEAKVEEPSGPTIRAQITNTKKASSGKSFVEALRGSNAAKRTEAAIPPVSAEPVAPAEELPQAAQPPAVEEVVVAEPEVVPEPAPLPEEPAPEPVEPEPEVEVRPRVPVRLPEADAHFSWADEEFTFVNQYPQTEQPVEPIAPTYQAQYPQVVIDTHQQSNGRFQFKAPVDQMTIDSVRSALEKERLQLENDRQAFEDLRHGKDMELRNKQAHIESMERKVADQCRVLDQERAKFKQEQEHAKAQAQAQAQFQQQQQSPAPPPVNAPHALQQQQAPGYMPSQDPVSWGVPPQQERWGEPTDTMPAAPPYDQNANYYQNFPVPFPEHRPKGGYGGYGGMLARGGASQQLPMGRGSMRGGPGAARPAYNRRPMGIPRGAGPENGQSHMFQQPPHSSLHLSPPVQSRPW